MNSKTKGNRFEKEIANELSLWVSKGKTTDIFYRTHGSGSIATSNKKELMKNQAGDITSVDKQGMKFLERYMVECKSYRSLDIKRMIYKQQGFLVDVFLHTQEQAIKYGKRPLLIAKELRCPVIVCGEYNTWRTLTKSPKPQSFQLLKVEEQKMELFLLDDLLSEDYDG